MVEIYHFLEGKESVHILEITFYIFLPLLCCTHWPQLLKISPKDPSSLKDKTNNSFYDDVFSYSLLNNRVDLLDIVRGVFILLTRTENLLS